MKAVAKKDSSWKDRYYTLAYELARDGCAKKDIPATLGVDEATWARWVKTNKTLAKSIERGVAKQTNTKPSTAEPVFKYVYRHLPRELRSVWDRIERAFRDAEVTEAEGGPRFDHEGFLEGIMRGRGARCRQHIYVHALVACNFDGNKACLMTGVSHSEVSTWAANDEGFRELCRSIISIQKDFVQGAAFNLIRRGDSPMTIWATKCLLADRGWKPPPKETKNEHVGGMAHLHAHVAISEDELDGMTPDEIQAVLEARKAVRAARERKMLPASRGEVIDSPEVTSHGD